MTRPDLFVYIALAAAWVLIAAWTHRIGRMAHQLQARVEEATTDAHVIRQNGWVPGKESAVDTHSGRSNMPEYSERLRLLIEGSTPLLLAMAPQEDAARPGPGKWSPREVMGHLVDSASNNHQRFVRAQLQDALVFPGYDQNAWVEVQRYQTVPWDDLVHLWRSFNLHLARLMEVVPEPVRMRARLQHNLDEIAWETVPADEPTTLDYLMRDYVGHLEHHVRQVLGDGTVEGLEEDGGA